jgi:glycosyltransferase involved in cell wall biosynthesis
MNGSTLQTDLHEPETARVTIVTPILNAAEFLDGAVQGVLAQAYPWWELLLVDNGSTDGSQVLAERYAALDLERIRCLHHRHRANRGATASRSRAIEHAREEFVALLDAGDRWEPRKLEKQIAFPDRHPNVAAVGSWYRQTDRSRLPDRSYGFRARTSISRAGCCSTARFCTARL